MSLAFHTLHVCTRNPHAHPSHTWVPFQATQLCQATCHPMGSGVSSQSHVSTWRNYSPSPSHGFSGGLSEASHHHVTSHQYCSPWGSSPLKMATPGPGGDSSSGPSPPWSTHPWTISTLRIVWVINFINIGNAYLIFQDLQPDQLQGSFGCLEPVLYCLTGSLFPRNGQVLSCPETWPHYPHSTPVLSPASPTSSCLEWSSCFSK